MSASITIAPKTDLKTGRHARFIYLYLPLLSISRMARHHKLDETAPIAIYAAQKGADRIIYCNHAAGEFGIAPDMSLSDARALCGLCRFFPQAADADRQWLTLLGRWCWRYSPVVGVDEARFGIWIDCTGTDHLWDSPQALLHDIASYFAAQALEVHIVMASYYGAALGLAISCLPDSPLVIDDSDEAHYEALNPLPLSALRLSQEICDELAAIGMTAIGDLWQLKRGMIAMRFSEDVILRRDQIFGHSPERPVPLAQFQPLIIQQHYAEPLGGTAILEQMLYRLLEGIAEMLTQMMLGCRHVEIGWQTLEGAKGHISHNLSRPSRDVRLLKRLFHDAAATIDAGFGIDYAWAKAGSLSAQMPQAIIFDDEGSFIEDEQDKISQLVDQLSARLGADKVQSMALKQSWIPEESQSFITAQKAQHIISDSTHSTVACDDGIGALVSTPRPIRLLAPPEAIQAIALLPDHPPSQIRWRGKNWRIIRATGPERIGPKWWHNTQQQDKISRDYYRLETQCGHRLWVYRHGLPQRGEAISWYLHGLFA